MTGAVSVRVSTVPTQGTGAGSSPSAALHDLRVLPIPVLVAKQLLCREHYLHSLPGGTKLTFGVFLGSRLLGALTLGAGPFLAYQLVEGAAPDDCLTLTRLWLSDELPVNSESRVIGIVLRALRTHSAVKFLISYADPSHGHFGTIYQATNWLYTGLSEAMSLYDVGDGAPRHSRSVAHAYGTHSVRYLTGQGVPVKLVPQARKHRYVYFIDPAWRSRLRMPELPYPKREAADENH